MLEAICAMSGNEDGVRSVTNGKDILDKALP